MMNIINEQNFKGKKIGNKAYNLFLLKKNGINVPKLICVNNVEDNLKEYIDVAFSKDTKFAVRSSSLLEDSEKLSFAGQFNTFLNISKEEVEEYVYKCLQGVSIEKLKGYTKESKKIDMYAIIQEMIIPEKSGVIFTSNPQGILNETVIVVGKGTGDNIVEEKVDTTSYYYNLNDNIYYYESYGNSIKLTKKEVETLINVSKKIKEILGEKLDIEFCIKDGQIYILQARKITTLDNGKEIILDNSNIVESYPGVTLPFTQSFIKEAYYGVFKGVFKRLTDNSKVLEKYDDVLRNTVEVSNGRMYYKINNFYNILNVLPFSSFMISTWQEMIGVENKEVIVDKNLKVGFFVKLKIIKNFFKLLKTNNREMYELNNFFKEIENSSLKKLDFENSSEELINLYLSLKDKIITRWYLTLINDMYAFIYTALLKMRIKKEYPKDYKNVSNIVIANISNLESMKPVKELVKISKYIRDNNLVDEINTLKDDQQVFQYIYNGNSQLKILLRDYISYYGDRNVEELKLESDTFRTNPKLLIDKILQYISDESLDKYIKDEKRELKVKLSKKANKYLQKAKIGIKNREISRLSRSKLYGVMRNISLNIGKNFVKMGKIEKVKDIYYLYYDEVVQGIENKNINLLEIVEKRKLEYGMYKKLPTFSRIIFKDRVINKHHNNINSEVVLNDFNVLTGTPASSGKVIGEVVVVNERNVKDVDTKDKIIVTKMTDPGWVYLIVKAKGLISQKGSLLSHSSIISRELNKPSVVGVKNVTDILKDGQKIELDATSGVIKILK